MWVEEGSCFLKIHNLDDLLVKTMIFRTFAYLLHLSCLFKKLLGQLWLQLLLAFSLSVSSVFSYSTRSWSILLRLRFLTLLWELLRLLRSIGLWLLWVISWDLREMLIYVIYKYIIWIHYSWGKEWMQTKIGIDGSFYSKQRSLNYVRIYFHVLIFYGSF